MNEKRAKQIRMAVYGEDGAPRYRKYQIERGQITADPIRQLYQKTKKSYKEDKCRR